MESEIRIYNNCTDLVAFISIKIIPKRKKSTITDRIVHKISGIMVICTGLAKPLALLHMQRVATSESWRPGTLRQYGLQKSTSNYIIDSSILIKVENARSEGSFDRTVSRFRVLATRGGREGGAVIERPDFLTKDGSNTPQTESGRGSIDKSKNAGGGGSYRVLLLHSPNHSEERVVKAITSVVPGTDEAHASNCYYTAKSLGMAIVTTALLEIAEFYAQQMYRMGCRTSIEPDSTVV